MIGVKLGSYVIEQELGRGGMGVVYKARQPSLDRLVAIKTLPWGLESDPEYLERFRREALAAAQLNHPNIVTVYDIAAEGNIHYIAMEFIQGRELAQIIKERGRLGTRESLSIARQVAGALGAAHALNVIHRDIKPSNIMIDAAGRAKVMDFGIAKLTSANTQLTRGGMILGTPEYMPPEQVQGFEIDARADLYALGIVLYQMLAGQVPFQAPTPIAVLRKIIEMPVPPIREFKPRLPDSVVNLIEKALAKDAHDRFESGLEMEEELARILYSGELPEEETTAVPMMMGSPPTTPSRVQTAYGKTGERATPTPQKPLTIAPPPSPEGGGAKLALAAIVVAALLVVAGAAFMVFSKKQDGSAPPDKPIAAAPAPAAPVEPPPAPAVIAPTVEPTPEPPPAPAPALPVIRWRDAPAEGAEIAEGKITVSWESANAALVNGYVVGLNDPNPTLFVQDRSRTFDLKQAGEQVLTVIPMSRDDQPGEPLKRTFIYKPSQPPTIGKASLKSDSIPAGQPGKFTISAADPRKEKVTTEVRLNGGEWIAVAAAEKAIAALAPGKHVAEARATNASGLSSEITPIEFEIKKPPEAPPIAAPEMPAVAAPAPAPESAKPAGTTPAGKVVSSSGGMYGKISEAIAKSSPGSRLTIGPGKYSESIVLDKNIELIGGGSRDEVVIESPAGACIAAKSGKALVRGVTLRALTSKGDFKVTAAGDTVRPTDTSFAGAFAGAVHAAGGELTVEDCVLQTAFFPALRVEIGVNPTLRKCIIKGKGRGAAVHFADGAKGVMEDCDLTGTFLWGIDVRAGASPSITRCRIHAFELDGIYFEEKAGGLVDDCDVFDNESHGITLHKGSRPTIRASRVVKNGMEGIYAPGDSLGSVEGNDLTRNGGLGAYNLSLGAKKSLKLSNNKDE